MAKQSILSISVIAIMWMSVLFACNNENNKQVFDPVLPFNSKFDTAAYLKKLNLKDTFNQLAWIDSFDDKVLRKEIDTMVLRSVMYSCLCPHWVIKSAYDKNIKHNDERTGEFEAFDIAKNGFYLESVTGKNEIDQFGLNWNVVRVIGREHIKIKNYPDRGGDSYRPGREFRYYYFEVIRPYEVAGPRIYDEEGDDNGNVPDFPAHVLVK